jgi:hypothetical protein
MSAWLVALIFFLIVMLLLAAAFWCGRKVTAAVGPAGSVSWTMLVISGFLTLISVLALISFGLLTIWPSVLLLGFFLGRTSRQRLGPA